eukprot:6770548-Ditylum_brightwellii.AAC.1
MIDSSVVNYDKGAIHIKPQTAQTLNPQTGLESSQKQQGSLAPQVAEKGGNEKNKEKEREETDEKIRAMNEKFQSQLDAMRNEFKDDMSSLKKDIENNVNKMVSKVLEMSTTMVKGKTAEMKSMFNTLMAWMEGLTNPSKAETVQVTPSKDLSRDQNINTAVSPKQQQGFARFRVTH